MDFFELTQLLQTAFIELKKERECLLKEVNENIEKIRFQEKEIDNLHKKLLTLEEIKKNFAADMAKQTETLQQDKKNYLAKCSLMESEIVRKQELLSVREKNITFKEDSLKEHEKLLSIKEMQMADKEETLKRAYKEIVAKNKI